MVVWSLRAAAAISIITTVGIVIVLLRQSLGFFGEIPIWEFLGGTVWTPLFKPQNFGVLPLVGGTLLVAGVAGIVALGLGLARRFSCPSTRLSDCAEFLNRSSKSSPGYRRSCMATLR